MFPNVQLLSATFDPVDFGKYFHMYLATKPSEQVTTWYSTDLIAKGFALHLNDVPSAMTREGTVHRLDVTQWWYITPLEHCFDCAPP